MRTDWIKRDAESFLIASGRKWERRISNGSQRNWPNFFTRHWWVPRPRIRLLTLPGSLANFECCRSSFATAPTTSVSKLRWHNSLAAFFASCFLRVAPWDCWIHQGPAACYENAAWCFISITSKITALLGLMTLKLVYYLMSLSANMTLNFLSAIISMEIIFS